MNHLKSTGPFLRIDEIWLSREPLDMRCGAETTLARVVQAFGMVKPHCACVFADQRANRMKILLCDGFGVWLLARRLHRGRFVWSALRSGDPVTLDALKELIERYHGLRLWNLYGQTEIAPVATVLQPEEQLPKARSAGKPVLNVETRVVDDDGNCVAAGEIGEVVHRSPQ